MFVSQGILDSKSKFIEICRTGVGIEMPNFTVLSDNQEQSILGEDAEGTRYVLEGYLFPDTYRWLRPQCKHLYIFSKRSQRFGNSGLQKILLK